MNNQSGVVKQDYGLSSKDNIKVEYGVILREYPRQKPSEFQSHDAHIKPNYEKSGGLFSNKFNGQRLTVKEYAEISGQLNY